MNSIILYKIDINNNNKLWTKADMQRKRLKNNGIDYKVVCI